MEMMVIIRTITYSTKSIFSGLVFRSLKVQPFIFIPPRLAECKNVGCNPLTGSFRDSDSEYSFTVNLFEIYLFRKTTYYDHID